MYLIKSISAVTNYNSSSCFLMQDVAEFHRLIKLLITQPIQTRVYSLLLQFSLIQTTILSHVSGPAQAWSWGLGYPEIGQMKCLKHSHWFKLKNCSQLIMWSCWKHWCMSLEPKVTQAYLQCAVTQAWWGSAATGATGWGQSGVTPAQVLRQGLLITLVSVPCSQHCSMNELSKNQEPRLDTQTYIRLNNWIKNYLLNWQFWSSHPFWKMSNY